MYVFSVTIQAWQYESKNCNLRILLLTIVIHKNIYLGLIFTADVFRIEMNVIVMITLEASIKCLDYAKNKKTFLYLFSVTIQTWQCESKDCNFRMLLTIIIHKNIYLALIFTADVLGIEMNVIVMHNWSHQNPKFNVLIMGKTYK